MRTTALSRREKLFLALAAAAALVRMGYNAPEDFEGEGITN